MNSFNTKKYIQDNEPYLAEFDEGGYLGTDEQKLLVYLEKYYEVRNLEERTSNNICEMFNDDEKEGFKNHESCGLLDKKLLAKCKVIALGVWNGTTERGEVMSVCFEKPNGVDRFWSDDTILRNPNINILKL